MTNEELLDVLANDQSYKRWHAASASGKLGDVRALHLVLHMFEEEPPAALATALGNLGHTRAVESLIQALQDQE